MLVSYCHIRSDCEYKLYPIFLNLPVQCSQTNFQQTGGFRLIPLRVLQHTRNVTTFHSRKLEAARCLFIRLFVVGILDVKWQIGNSQLFAFANNKTAFYHITEFADISFPRL